MVIVAYGYEKFSEGKAKKILYIIAIISNIALFLFAGFMNN